MADSTEAARFFAERVANEAVAQDHGHLPVSREGFVAEASWYRNGETLHFVLEAFGQECELPLHPDGADAREQIAQAVEEALVGLRPA